MQTTKIDDQPTSARTRPRFDLADPAPTPQRLLTQIGVHFEEVGEMFEALQSGATALRSYEALGFGSDVMAHIQRRLKEGSITVSPEKLDRAALLDALCGQVGAAIGIARMFDMDIEGALQEAADSNASKDDKDA